MTNQNQIFDHEKLDVYQVSLEYLRFMWATCQQLDGAYRHIRDQGLRASLSIVLNIAEGNGKWSQPDRKRFFDIARGSATECAGCMDALVVTNGLTEELGVRGKLLLKRIVAMLTKMTERSTGMVREDDAAYESRANVSDYDYAHEHEHEKIPFLTLPGEGPVYVSLGQENTIKVSADATGGTLCAVEILVPPGSGTPPHIHTLEDETFYVLEGTTRFTVAGKQIDATPGTTLFGPRNVIHNFVNASDKPTRLLCICTPGTNMESFFAELGAVPLGQQPDEVVALCTKHGIQLPEIPSIID